MLTSKVPFRRLTLPHEPDAWIEVRMLSGLQLQHAQAAARHERITRMHQMGPELVRATITSADPEAIKAARADNADDPLDGYDRRTLLLEGIVDWGYGEPVTPENIDDLDEETMQYVALQLLPHDRTEEDRKNGSDSSTPTSTVGASTRPKTG